jgi:hypothetical protein
MVCIGHFDGVVRFVAEATIIDVMCEFGCTVPSFDALFTSTSTVVPETEEGSLIKSCSTDTKSTKHDEAEP